MAGSITITDDNVLGGSDKQIQYNDSGVLAGAAQLFWDKANDRLGIGDSTPAKQLSITKCMELLDTTTDAIGVIYKGVNRFIHNFHHPTGGGAVPDGQNTFLGELAGNFSMGSGATSSWHSSKNVGIGMEVLFSNTLGYECTGIGHQALRAHTTGNRNMALGSGAMRYTTSGSSNMALGRYALYYNVSGSYNSIVGSNAAQGVVGNSVHRNTVVGFEAGKVLANGGNNNILLGYRAGDNITSGEGNIILGYDLNALVAAGDNQLNIGSLIFGDLGATKKLGVNTSTLNETLSVGGGIRLGTSALTNAGTIRWNGANFQGYKGGAWINLDTTAGLWTDAGQYIRPNAAANYRVLDAGTDLSTVSFAANTTHVLTPGTTYSISATLTISSDYVTILGYGAKIIKTAHCSLKLSGNHCKLIGFEMDGDSQGDDNVYVTGSYNEINGITSHHATHASWIGIGIALTKEGTPTPSAKYNVVTGCVCYNNHMGIGNWKGMYNTISNNYTYNSTADGYTCDGDAGTAEYAYGNIYIGNRSYNDAHGIGVDSAHYCTFVGNHVKGTTTFGGITTWNIEGPCSHCTFTGNTLENNNLYGICIGDGVGGITTHCKLSGNTYHNNGSGDWYVDPDCDYNIIMEDDIYIRNNKALYHRNAANTAWLQTLHTDAWDGVTLGKAAAVVVLGTDSAAANPVAIRVNGTNTQYITRSADTDGAGKHYLVVT